MVKFINITDIDPYQYFPIKNGIVPPSSIKMEKFSNLPEEQQKIFQIDQSHYAYTDNKVNSRKENLAKYYQKKSKINISPIIRFISAKLKKDWPEYFSYTEDKKEGIAKLFCKLTNEDLLFDINNNWNLIKSNQNYLDAFDALAMQVPEDMIVCTLPDEGEDFVSYAHLMSASGWAADWAIGKSFWEIHEGVLKNDGTPVIKNSSKIVKGILRMPVSFQRVGAISFRSNLQLNRHPDNIIPDVWNFDKEQKIFLRFERQTVTSFPEINSFLFTIRTYFNDMLKPSNVEVFKNAIENAHEDNYARDFLAKNKEKILNFLEKKHEKQTQTK